jgi:hypothetical protein
VQAANHEKWLAAISFQLSRSDMTDQLKSRDKIRMLNDTFRRTLTGGRVLATAGIATRPDIDQIVTRVRQYLEFSEGDDPYGEHDMGWFVHSGDKIMWKIDYYGPSLEQGSDDPSNPNVTTRVLTIMLAHEY